jgi:hypothetical protein
MRGSRINYGFDPHGAPVINCTSRLASSALTYTAKRMKPSLA